MERSIGKKRSRGFWKGNKFLRVNWWFEEVIEIKRSLYRRNKKGFKRISCWKRLSRKGKNWGFNSVNLCVYIKIYIKLIF